MKILKKLLASVMCCMLVVGCCLGFAGCSDDDVETAKNAGTEVLGSSIATTYNSSYAEGIYYNALANSRIQTEHCSKITQYDRTEMGLEDCSITVMLNNKIYYMSSDDHIGAQYIKDGKIYDVGTETYSENVVYDQILSALYAYPKAIEATEREFVGAELNKGETKIFIKAKVSNDFIDTHITVSITDNLITGFNVLMLDENGNIDRISVATISYENVHFGIVDFSDYKKENNIIAG